MCSEFAVQKIKSVYFFCFPFYLPWSDGTRCHDISFLNVEFKPTFSLSSFTFIKRLFSYSSLSAVREVSSAYLRLLIFLLAILIPACASSSPAFLMMYSACKLNKQGDNIQPWCIPFPICINNSSYKFRIFDLVMILKIITAKRTLFLSFRFVLRKISVSIELYVFPYIHKIKNVNTVKIWSSIERTWKRKKSNYFQWNFLDLNQETTTKKTSLVLKLTCKQKTKYPLTLCSAMTSSMVLRVVPR